MKYDLIIAQGTVILEHDAVQADIAIKDGKIAAIGQGLGDAQNTIDATGCIVSPGMVDTHVHLSEPGRTDWEGYETGTKAAAKGGVTTCIEMPLNQLPATVDRESLRLKFDASKGKLHVDIAPFGGLVPYNLDRLHELDEEGVVAYKCFLATCGDPNVENDFANVNDYSFLKGLQILAKRDQLVAVHAENAAICDGLGKEAVREGRLTAYDYVASRPVYAEVEAIRRAIFLAKVAGCRLHICHISCPEGVDEVTKARQSGQEVTCETCIHYLTLDTDQFDKIGALAKCSPPIRDHKNQQGMWEKLLAGEIDCVASDHSPCVPSMKEGNIMKAWGGLASLQNNVDLLFDEGVKKRHMDLALFAKLIAANPADIFRLKDKGRLEVGKDADIVLIDPKASYTLQASDLEYRHKISAFVGRKIDARVKMTLVRGNVVYRLDQGFDKPCVGKFVFKSK